MLKIDPLFVLYSVNHVKRRILIVPNIIVRNFTH